MTYETLLDILKPSPPSAQEVLEFHPLPLVLVNLVDPRKTHPQDLITYFILYNLKHNLLNGLHSRKLAKIASKFSKNNCI